MKKIKERKGFTGIDISIAIVVVVITIGIAISMLTRISNKRNRSRYNCKW